MTVDRAKEDWLDNIKTIEDLTELLEHGCEFDVKYKGIEYHIENYYLGFCIGNRDIGVECRFDIAEKFIEKATIGGDLLKDVMDKIEYTWGA